MVSIAKSALGLLVIVVTSQAVDISGSIGQLRGKELTGLIHGDVVPRRKTTRNTITDETRYWPSTTIPIRHGLGLSLEAVGSIQLAQVEYKLRTCLNFVERTTESNYINFRSLSGCYSSVGMVGGSQTLSLGSGCERMATVCHEMMHAIGIWHEQSRPDRDDYVEIKWEDIEPGYEHNFNKYDFNTADPRRVPYDYNSIMHYSDSGFSTNGNPTIVTRDPAFQTLIGQRMTFSKGDTDKINRMYQCSDTLLYSYNCNFDEEAACGYSNDYSADTTSWKPYFVGDKTVTVPLSAPTMDSTQGISARGAYLILDTTSKSSGLSAEVRSMRYLSKAAAQCLQFSYYVSKDASSNAAVSANLGTLNDDTGEIISSSVLATITDDTQGKWKVQRITINAPSAYRITFAGKTAAYEDTFAIDDVSVQDRACEDGLFITEDYSSVLQTYQKGQSILSPVMTSTQGYNFRVLLYPQGTSSAATGYMSLYFGLVQGPDDDSLNWPFCNKYIRMSVLDQPDDPLYGLNKYSEYLTTQSAGGDLWNQPTSSTSAGYYGYSNFMKISDLQTTNDYLKLDRLMVSVLIKDMTEYTGEVCSGTFTRSLDAPLVGLGFAENTFVEPQGSSFEFDDKEHDDKDHHDMHHHGDCEDDDHEGYIKTGAAIGITFGVAFLVFFVMLAFMCYGVQSRKQQARTLTNNVVVHSNAPSEKPPSYADGSVAFDKLPMPNV